MRQAETWLAMEPSYRGRRLKRILLRLERKTGREILTRLGGRGDRVTRSALRRHCRHLIPSREDELRERFVEFLRGIDVRIESSVAEHVAEKVEPELEALRECAEAHEEALKELGRRYRMLDAELARVAAVGRRGPGLSSRGESTQRGRSDRPGKPGDAPSAQTR